MKKSDEKKVRKKVTKKRYEKFDAKFHYIIGDTGISYSQRGYVFFSG